MKFNWGTGLTIATISFMSFILFMVYKTTTVNKELVAEDYYAQELVYQQRINKMENVKTLGQSVTWQLTDTEILLAFPSTNSTEPISGTVDFFRPSDGSFDQQFTIKAHPGTSQSIPLDNLPSGSYHLKIDWQSNGTAYYQENHIFIK